MLRNSTQTSEITPPWYSTLKIFIASTKWNSFFYLFSHAFLPLSGKHTSRMASNSRKTQGLCVYFDLNIILLCCLPNANKVLYCSIKITILVLIIPPSPDMLCSYDGILHNNKKNKLLIDTTTRLLPKPWCSVKETTQVSASVEFLAVESVPRNGCCQCLCTQGEREQQPPPLGDSSRPAPVWLKGSWCTAWLSGLSL